MSESKVVIAGWLMVDPARRDEVVENHKDLMLRARDAPGCLDLAVTADPVDPGRINNFELWQSEEALELWRSVSNPPEKITPVLESNMQKHIIEKSRPPF